MAIQLSGNTIINDARTFINYGATHNALGSISSNTTIDLRSGNYVSATIAGNLTFTFSNPLASPNAFGFMLELTNAGAFTVVFPTSVKWPSAASPILTVSGTDVLLFLTDDGGTTWRGIASMIDSR